MSDVKLRVEYKNAEPQTIKYGRGLMGETTSLAHMRGSTAVVAFDNAGSLDFEKELAKLPFVQAVKMGDNDG